MTGKKENAVRPREFGDSILEEKISGRVRRNRRVPVMSTPKWLLRH